MEWRLFANLAEAAGTKRAEVDAAAGDTLGDAFEQLLEANPDLEPIVVDSDGELREHIRLLHNGEDPFAVGEGFDTVLDAGDQLALFPPVSGGRR
jgi:molybdopterin synthase sulfur carrier subunit